MDAYSEHDQRHCGRCWCGGCGSRRGWVLAMRIFSSLRAFFRGGTPGFRPLERQVLDGVLEQLDADRATKLRERIARINLVQRLDGGREANVYEMKNGMPVIDSSLRLSDAAGETVLAVFSLSTRSGSQNTEQVWLVDGRFVSLEFDRPTEHMLDERLNTLQVRLAA